MGGYAIAFGVATWLFAAPWLGYFASAAVFGAGVAGSTYLGDLAAGARSLAMASVGLILWAACRVLISLKVADAYRVPVVRSARAIAALALLFAAYAAWPWGGPSWTAASALWVLAVLYLLIGLEMPLPTVACAPSDQCKRPSLSLISIQLAAEYLGRPIDRVWLGTCAWGDRVGL